MSQNSRAKRNIISKYGCRCMLTGITLQKESDFSYHHIEKEEWGGKATVKNGASLHIPIHQWLHNVVETKDKELFLLINEVLLLYKEVRDKQLNELIEEYENEVMPIFKEKEKEYTK